MTTPSDLQIAKPLTLKSGLTLPNRLVKAAMAEQFTGANNLPDERLQAVYKHWASAGWGLIITGHVHVDSAYLGHPLDNAIPTDTLPASTLTPAYTAYAAASQGGTTTPTTPTTTRTPAIVQLNHPGRQSPRGAGTRSLFTPAMAPSAIPLSLGPGLIPWFLRSLVFGTPRVMTQDDIDTVISQFARAARVVADAGFAGVEIHAAHGYLLSQFLSAKSNKREDGYGGDARGRARLVGEIVRAVREETKDVERFTVGIKLNSADYQGEGEVREWIEQVRVVVEAGVDFVEISGGSYEDPTMFQNSVGPDPNEGKSDRTIAREAFFLEFAKILRKEFPDVPLMVTGGFSSRLGLERAVADGDCDLVGLGRPAATNPSLPNNIIFNAEIKDQDATLYRKQNKTPWILKQLGMASVGAGIDSQWHTNQIQEFVNL